MSMADLIWNLIMMLLDEKENSKNDEKSNEKED